MADGESRNGARQRPQRFHGRVAGTGERCAAAGCGQPGEFRAPRDPAGRGRAGDWQWLCLDHVRAFNADYNYFDGLTPDAVARERGGVPGWDRATRPFASNAAADPLDLLGARFGPAAVRGGRTPAGKPLSTKDIEALARLGLDGAASSADVRRAYKALLRRYHPDTNGGDRRSEAKLRLVIDAYTHLKTSPAFADA